MDEMRLKKILDASLDMYLVIDGSGVLVDYLPSRNFKPALPPENFIGRRMEEVLPLDLAEAALLRTKDVLETGEESVFEYNLPLKGVPRYYEARFTPFDESQVLAIIRDVTGRRSSRQAAEALMNASQDLFFLLDRQGCVRFINQSAAGLFGKTPTQMEGTLYWDHLSPEKARLRKKRMKDVLRSGHSNKIVHLSDEKVFEATLNPVLGTDGTVQYVAYFVKDITDQVKSEQELIASEARHRHLFNENPLPMYIYDTESLMILDANTAMIDSYGYAKSELTSMTIGDIRPPEDVSKVMKNVSNLRTRQVYLGVWRHRKKDDSVIDVEITSSDFPLMGRPACLVLCNDVTEKIRIQRALEERELQYRHLFEYNPMPMFVTEVETLQILNVNIATVNHYGYEKEELLNMTLKDIRPPEDVEKLEEVMRAKSAPIERSGIFRHVKKDGAIMLMDISSHEIYYEGKKARLALCNDVTDEIRAKKALEESEEKFRKVFFTSPDPMTISRIEDGVLLEVNEGFLKTTGYSEKECLGKSTVDLGIWASDKQRREMTDKLKKEGSVENHEITIKDKHGSMKMALVSAAIVSIADAPRMFTISRDITDLKKTQEALIQSEEQLRASLEEKEMLLKEIHHRVKNNLQVISGLLDLQAYHIGNSMGREIYKESQNRVITMALIHEELYRSTSLSEVDFADYIRNLSGNLMVSYGTDRNRIKLDVEAEKTEMVVDTAIPCGLIINELITNSLKHAFPDKRKGTISLSFRQLRNKDYLLTIGDDGVGLPRNMDIHNTNTLGMQLVTVMVKQLGGTLMVRRKGGTRFTIRFREYHEAGSVLY